MKKKLVLGLLSAGLLTAPLLAAQNSSAQSAASRTSSAFQAPYQTSQSQAESAAVKAMGGGQVTHISNDTYQGQAVYDIHVLYNGTLYDVKVSQNSGVVVQKKLSSEQPSSSSTGSSTSSSSSSSNSTVSSNQAGQTAIHVVGGGQVTHISNDTYQGQAVYDIHVLYNGTLYDVKISVRNGVVMLKKLSSEQPSSSSTGSSASSSSSSSSSTVGSSQAGQLAINAVGGGSVIHISADHYQGVGVWDVHVSYQNQVWDVKITQSNGAVAQKKLSSEQNSTSSSDKSSNSSDSKDQPDHQSSPSPSSSGGSIQYNQKLTTVPSAYQSYVNQALQQENGSLKWVKFIQKHNGETQANIKIRRAQGGTVKVKDLFSASGQLIQQKVNR